MHRAVCLKYWHTARTPMHNQQDMPLEVSSQSPSQEHRTTWNSNPHQVKSVKLYFKTDTNTPYGTVGTVKHHRHRPMQINTQ